MSTVGWIIVVILAIPMIGLLGWLFVASSMVRVPSGSLGLLMVRGRATDTALLPGRHLVPALRQQMLEIYPSTEMSFRAGPPDPGQDSDLDRTGPAVPATLGDRTTTSVPYALRFRLIPERLREIHERVGPDGVYASVRDASGAALVTALRDSGVTVDSFFGVAVEQCEADLRESISHALRAQGIELSSFLLGTPDLGRTGEVIQATLRARHELEREQAEAGTRMVRAVNDADLNARLPAAGEPAWRYRETELWSEIVERTEALQVALRAVGPPETARATTTANEPTLQQAEHQP